MWKRNLLFLGLVLGASATLWANLLPPRLATTVPGAVDGKMESAKITTPGLIDDEIVDRIDEAFRADWSRQGLGAARPAPELAVYRRLALALTGTLPSLAEIRRFESRPEGRRLGPQLDAILRDRRYADYFGERLARAFVGTEAGPFLVFRRHRFVVWLSDQLQKDRRYDAIVRDMIAARGIWTDRPEVNFITVAYDPERKLPDPDRLASRVARAFLGVRLDCARCHDHPFQPWTRADFQGLAAFFGQVRVNVTGFRDDPKAVYTTTDRKTGNARPVTPRVPFRPELLPAAPARDPRERLSRWVTDPANPSLGRATVNRVWALMFGRPLVEPVDDLTGVDDPPAALRLLADDFNAHGYDLRRLIRVIAATRAFRLDSAAEPEPTEAHEAAWTAFPLTRLRPEQVAGAIAQAATLETINDDAHILVKLATADRGRRFVRRYGDHGEDEFGARAGTIPQRLLLMNGAVVHDATKPELFNAGRRIAMQAPDDRAAVEVAFLSVLTRRPTAEESAHFAAKLAGTRGDPRNRQVSDLVWTLLNGTEFSWNH